MVLDGNKIGLYSVFPIEGKFPEELKLCETEEFLRNYPYGIRIAGRSGERREEETILDLPPKNLVLGIGCRKGISEEEIQSAVNEAKKILGFTEKEVIEIDSIDLKKKRRDYFLMRQSGSFHFTRFQQKSWERLNVSAPIRSLSGRSRVWTMYVSGRRSLQPERMAGF